MPVRHKKKEGEIAGEPEYEPVNRPFVTSGAAITTGDVGNARAMRRGW
jgi:hypothetical protein